MLTQWFESLVQKNDNTNHWYVYFNFHKECDLEHLSALDEKLKIGGIAKFMKFFMT